MQITSGNMELARVTPEEGYVIYSADELQAIITRAQEEASAEGGR